MSQWQPIETAPKDGKNVLIYRLGSGDQRATIGSLDEEGVWQSPEAYYIWSWFDFSPTHWMPLPEPPK